jgi:hypothetical protein
MSTTSSSSAPTTDNTTRWPVYATKEDCLQDLESAVGGGTVALMVILKRLSNTDTSTWSDKGSIIN